MILADVATSGYYFAYGFAIIAAICIAIGVICAGIAIAETSKGWSDYSTDNVGSWVIASLCFLACGAVIGGITLWASWPLKYEYHHWVTKSGVVTKVASRFIPAGDSSVQQRIVLVINGQPYGVDDTRASLVKPGDHVEIKCKKDHQFQQDLADDGWQCRWGA